MLPKEEYNIYPKTEENLKALLIFYFGKYDLPMENALDDLLSKTSLSLNQIEFILRKLSESYKVLFVDFFKNTTTTATNLINYGIEALTIDEVKWRGSKARLAKTKEFLEYVQQTEKDFSYFEKYN